MSDPQPAMPSYRIFGINLQSAVSFDSRLAPRSETERPSGGSASTLTFRIVDQPPFSRDYSTLPAAYASQSVASDGRNRVYVYRLQECDVIRFTNVIDFYLYSDHIAAHLLTAGLSYMVEIYLLGIVLSFFRERCGIPMLHTSAVVIDGQAVSFLSSNKGGKSSLAASFMQLGCPLLSDDILPVEKIDGRPFGHPGYPTMRMWPAEADHFLGHFEKLSIVHPAQSKRRVVVGAGGFGTFCAQPQPLSVIYLPQRRDQEIDGDQITIEPISPVDGVMELLRNSFIPRMVQALDRQPQRLTQFVELAQQIPMRRLSYPNGFEHLPRIREAICKDIGQDKIGRHY